jgi:hypothetical protein
LFYYLPGTHISENFLLLMLRKRKIMHQQKPGQGNLYYIRLKGILDHPIADWFGDITIIPQENSETLLVGRFTDQPALRGLLDQLWNLNLTVLSVERIENEPNK